MTTRELALVALSIAELAASSRCRQEVQAGRRGDLRVSVAGETGVGVGRAPLRLRIHAIHAVAYRGEGCGCNSCQV